MSPILRRISKKIAAESGFLRRIPPNCCPRKFSTIAADRQLLPPSSTLPPWLMQPPAIEGAYTPYNFYSPIKGNVVNLNNRGSREEADLPYFNNGNLFLSDTLSGLSGRLHVDLPAFPGAIMDPSEVFSPYDEEEFLAGSISEHWDLASTVFPKQFKGRMSGISHRGNHICFGKYALKAVEAGWVTSRQIEAGRRAMVRNARGAKIWVRVTADKPVTLKPAETRMGRGKGSPAFRVAVVQPGKILYELDGVAENVAKKAVIIAASKLPIATRFITSGYTV